ncbi:FHF complex subunit HOOK interacting protein 1B-like [Protopterus annectens]|uniref:FHF complex subunit HOOK interacting protein 1B-like n=1 Tax=Protopterus annectens TaxID=7888 RepID=UPI001CF96491|nr:FHF complex subunit HOOK interacting protein 1B-like [Protopterus annectens]
MFIGSLLPNLVRLVYCYKCAFPFLLQVAHPLVQNQLVDYVHNGFLVPVMGPALHKTSIEEMIATTAYLDLFLRSVSETALLKTFLRFILLHRHDNVTILDTLISRISSNSRLCMVSLSLFRTLMNLNCEDVMLQLVLRYLIPCNHVMLSQRRAVRDLDIYGKTADRFLSLIPKCCQVDNLVPVEREEEHAMWSKCHGSPSVDTSSVTTMPRPATPSRIALFIRQQSIGSSDTTTTPRSPGVPSSDTPVGSPIHTVLKWEEVAELESNYLEYLRDARMNIDLCVWACKAWSAPYDGEKPEPCSLPAMCADESALNLSTDHYGVDQQHGITSAPGGASSNFGRPILNLSSQRKLRSGSDNKELDSQINSITPRNKKRGLQHIHMPPVAIELAGTSCRECKNSDHIFVQEQQDGLPFGSVLNGAHPDDSSCFKQDSGRLDLEEAECIDGDLKIKKVRRDTTEQTPLLVNERLGRNKELISPKEIVTGFISEWTNRKLPAPVLKDKNSGHLMHAVTQNGTVIQVAEIHSLTSHEPSVASDLQRTESVESLIDQLLDKAPAEANGTSLNVEKFGEELQELEENMKNGEDVREEEREPDSPLSREEEEAFEKFTLQSGTDSPVSDAKREKAKSGTLSPFFLSPNRAVGQSLIQPFTGPFLAVLFTKLENMLHNSLYVNFLLTGMIAQLACYPQPLLRSFLLNTNMVFQPSVKSLIQVLGTVKNKIEAFAANQEDFPALLFKAKKYLIARGKLDWADSPTSVPALRRSETLVKSRKPSLGELILRHTNSPTRARQAAQLALQHVRDGQVLHALTGSSIFKTSAEKQNDALRVKNAVYCAVIFTEFLKELAAISQEHAVTSPYLLEDIEE